MPREKRDFKILCSKCGLMTTTHDDKNEYIDVISPDGETCKIISKRVITFTHESGKKCVVVIHPDISYLS